MTEPVTEKPGQAPAGPSAGAPAAVPPPAAPAAVPVTAPPVAPADPWAVVPVPPAPPRRRRPSARVLRAVGRWTAAVTVFGVFCAGTAYGIARMERHEVPGLATESDGRWEYPKLTLPALPAGSPRPFAKGNEAEIHHADLRDLLVPAPEGAGEDEKLPTPKGGWVTIEDYAKLYGEDSRGSVSQRLVDDAVRHVAARGWVMPDGTRTSVHLLRFNSGAVANDFHAELLTGGAEPGTALAAAPNSAVDEDWPSDTGPENVLLDVYDDLEPRGTHTRHAYLLAGDTVALIVQSRKGGAPLVPFHQTVILQAQLLG